LDSFLICISLLILSLSGYILWPSRYNALQHLAVGGSFVSIVVPALILNVQDQYSNAIVDLYTRILVVGTIAFVIGLFIGYIIGVDIKTHFSYNIMEEHDYEKRVVKITTNLMLAGIIGLAISYLVMGFIPMFAEDPISAKLFRGQYQQPYIRVAVIYRASFYIIATIMPITCIIWYKYRSKLVLFTIIAALVLMAMSLTRSGAFTGVVIAFAIVMAFKSKLHFFILMTLLIGIFVLSSFFYYIVGVRTYTGEKNVWEIITAGTPDIPDQLDFLTRFDEAPDWTYGRTVYGGLVPGHYKWNPAVYTLIMVNPGQDINDIGSGGLRLPLPMWGYVSFEWIGVIGFSIFTGIFSGIFIRIVKRTFQQFESILIRTVVLIAFGTVFGILVGFTQLSMYGVPPAIVSLFYLYRFRIK
jgi:oligosaccharide repeat unit polymerase